MTEADVMRRAAAATRLVRAGEPDAAECAMTNFHSCGGKMADWASCPYFEICKKLSEIRRG